MVRKGDRAGRDRAGRDGGGWDGEEWRERGATCPSFSSSMRTTAPAAKFKICLTFRSGVLVPYEVFEHTNLDLMGPYEFFPAFATSKSASRTIRKMHFLRKTGP